MIFAVDPGLDGAIAMLDGDHLEVHDMPTFKTGRGGKRVYDERVMWSSVVELADRIDLAVLEQQGPMKGQGVTSTFSTGTSWGLWRMALTASYVPWVTVRAQKWQKEIGCAPKSGKAGVAEVVLRAFPHAEIRGPKGGLKDGRADAIGLAMWGRQQNGGGK